MTQTQQETPFTTLVKRIVGESWREGENLVFK